MTMENGTETYHINNNTNNNEQNEYITNNTNNNGQNEYVTNNTNNNGHNEYIMRQCSLIHFLFVLPKFFWTFYFTLL